MYSLLHNVWKLSQERQRVEFFVGAWWDHHISITIPANRVAWGRLTLEVILVLYVLIEIQNLLA